MYIVTTQDNKIIRNFEDNKISCFDEIRSAEHLAKIINGKVHKVTEEEIKIANKRNKN